MDAAAAGAALPAVPGTLPAVDVVGDVAAAATVPRGAPLQRDGRVVQGGDGIFWSRGRPWGRDRGLEECVGVCVCV